MKRLLFCLLPLLVAGGCATSDASLVASARTGDRESARTLWSRNHERGREAARRLWKHGAPLGDYATGGEMNGAPVVAQLFNAGVRVGLVVLVFDEEGVCQRAEAAPVPQKSGPLMILILNDEVSVFSCSWVLEPSGLRLVE